MTPIWNRRRNWPGYALTLAALVAMLFVAACDRVEEPQEPDLLDLARDAYAIGQFTDAERYYQD